MLFFFIHFFLRELKKKWEYFCGNQRNSLTLRYYGKKLFYEICSIGFNACFAPIKGLCI